jgi:predicted dehydrogenase
MAKKRFACVGVGGRFCWFFLPAMIEDFAATVDIVAFCDNNAGRLHLAEDWARQRGVVARIYSDIQFDQMIAETKPDVVLVTSKDCTHDYYICRAMELGCDVITEKPMTTDEHKCQRIIDTQKKTGRKCTAVFNYRYSPPRTQVKDLLMSGVIGNVVSVDFHWLLDTNHGASYFRRWHSNRVNTGGLQVHKATHHFDLVNWWLSSVPEVVYATGARNFYRPETAERYGLTRRGERCLDCAESGKCPFYLDLREYPLLTSWYLDQEKYDGYIRDRCLFRADIDIEDTLDLIVNYRSGAMMSYSLHTFMPWEGYIVAFNGTKGRLEQVCQETVYFNGDGTVPGQILPEKTSIKIYPQFQPYYEVELWLAEGGHAGGDPALARDLFGENLLPDRYKTAADYRSGAWSILVGVAVNRSMEWKRPVHIDELVHDLELPDYPPMPTAQEPIDPTPMRQLPLSWVG